MKTIRLSSVCVLWVDWRIGIRLIKFMPLSKSLSSWVFLQHVSAMNVFI